MANKKGQIGEWEEIIKVIILVPILIAVLGAIVTVLNQPECSQCEDCSPYKQDATDLSKELAFCKNQSKEIIYINQTIEVPVEKIIEKPVYKEELMPSIVISMSFILSLIISLTLFKIKLPENLEEKLEKIEKWIIRIKWLSLIVTILILIRLIYSLINLK